VALAAGTQVNPNVRLLRELGAGAMGEVWVADHLTLRTEVAVKFISAELAKEQPEIVKRFEREAAVAAQIKSPHVVQTFDRGVMDDGTPYIVMELMDGTSLCERLEEDGALTLVDTAQVVVHVARALRKAHELGVTHRDIKPDNIFVTTSDEGLFCKVLDFGIAKQAKLPQLEGLTSPGMLVGTPEFMSPEQFLTTEDVDFKADIWALAVTAYQCLTVQFPFPAKTLGALCAQLMKGTFPPPSEYRDDLPPEVDRFFARALAKEPSERFPSAREFAHAFVQLLPAGERGFEDTLAMSARGSASGVALRTPSSEKGTRVSAPNPLVPTGDKPKSGTLSGSATGVVPLDPRGARLVPIALGVAALLGGVVWLGLRGGSGEGTATRTVAAPPAAMTVSELDAVPAVRPVATVAATAVPVAPAALAAPASSLEAASAPSGSSLGATPAVGKSGSAVGKPVSAPPVKAPTPGNYGF
jgi:serine/threonine protein kinase